MKLKKHELYPTLLLLSAHTSDGRLLGLLHEDITLGLKRRLQKLAKEVGALYEEYLADLKEVQEKLKDDEAKLKEELSILDNEEVSFQFEKVSISMIESIKSENNYDFDLIERFAE